jgi:histidinol-phosphatase (PHP family)
VIDLHVHTARCGHASGELADYVEAARRRGLAAICFTDHLPMPAPYPQHYTMKAEELPAYVEDVRAAASEARARGGPEVLLGIEADWLPDAFAHVEEAISAYDFDLVLGSVHFLGDWAFDDPGLVARYDSWQPDVLWARYFDEIARAAASGLFDSIAHPDLVKKFGSRPTIDPRPWYEQTAVALADAGCAVEVNTGGLRKPVHEIYPAVGLLKACRRRGVAATMGSDAHAPGEVGEGLDLARELLLEAGYDSVTCFRKRVAAEVPL